jgi:hypothetical protein
MEGMEGYIGGTVFGHMHSVAGVLGIWRGAVTMNTVQ